VPCLRSHKIRTCFTAESQSRQALSYRMPGYPPTGPTPEARYIESNSWHQWSAGSEFAYSRRNRLVEAGVKLLTVPGLRQNRLQRLFLPRTIVVLGFLGAGLPSETDETKGKTGLMPPPRESLAKSSCSFRRHLPTYVRHRCGSASFDHTMERRTGPEIAKGSGKKRWPRSFADNPRSNSWFRVGSWGLGYR